MGPVAVIKNGFTHYAVLSGRAVIEEFWWWALFVGAAGSALFAVNPAMAAVFLLAAALPSVAVAVRRLHDTNRSGWWTLLALIPFPGLPFLAALLVFQGTRGANRFGPDPLGREAAGPMPPMPDARTKSVAEWQDRA